jgi:hypothetical protein
MSNDGGGFDDDRLAEGLWLAQDGQHALVPVGWKNMYWLSSAMVHVFVRPLRRLDCNTTTRPHYHIARRASTQVQEVVKGFEHSGQHIAVHGHGAFHELKERQQQLDCAQLSDLVLVFL